MSRSCNKATLSDAREESKCLMGPFTIVYGFGVLM